MKKRSTIILIGIQIFISLMFFINAFVINIRNIYIISSFLILTTLIVIFCLGYEKNRQRLKKDAFLNAIIYSSLLQLILYLSGLLFGFLENGYSTDFLMILKNLLPEILLIVTLEFLRYTINQKGRESKAVLIVSCITFIIIESTIHGMSYNFSNKKNIVELVCLIILPLISKNIFLTYNTTKFGYESSIIYRIISETLIYLIPIVPNISDYLKAITNFLYPLLIFTITKNTIGKNVPYEEVVYQKTNKFPLLISIIIILAIISLNSGLAPLYILAIGSGSMEKTLSKGDAVIVEKINGSRINNLEKGDILVYKYQNKVVVHRIYTIEFKDDNIYIKTKGDNNKFPDNWIVNKEHILGKVVFNIKYAGIPTVWLNDILD